MYWANFFHIYQPFDQRPEILERIVNESYRPLISGWLKNSQAHITLNINACLTERLYKNGYQDVINNLAALSTRGQLEFTASGKYHPFLPILPKKEIVRQIEINESTNKKFFGKAYVPLGFFPPEMGYSRLVGEVVRELGYKWIVLDEISFNGKIDQVKYDRLYRLAGPAKNNLYVFFRERRMSNLIMAAMLRTPQSLWEAVESENSKDRYLLTAMDGETFGHHRPGLDKMLEDLYQSDKYKLVKVSELLELFSQKESVNPVSSCWASSEKEINEGKNFYLYYNQANKLHKLQKQLINLAISSSSSLRGGEPKANRRGNLNKEDRHGPLRVPRDDKQRILLDQALSCNHMWWSNPDAWWSIEEIEKGAYNLRKACILRLTIVSNYVQTKSNDLYQKIMAQAFAWQRDGLPQRLHEEKEKFKKVPFKQRAKPEELEALLTILKEEETKAVERGEYELAIRWRDSRYKLEKGLDIYDFVHIVDQMRYEGRLGKYEELAKKYREEYTKHVPGQADK